MMAIWFLGASLGQYVAAIIAQFAATETVAGVALDNHAALERTETCSVGDAPPIRRKRRPRTIRSRFGIACGQDGGVFQPAA